jgi:hypothetical protein
MSRSIDFRYHLAYNQPCPDQIPRSVTMNVRPLLKFGRGNAKLGKEVYTFSLPSGHTCPFALQCLSRTDRLSGKLTDGPKTEFRCFSATQENVYPAVRNARWHNFDALRGLSTESMANLIELSLPSKARIVRIHVGGDFFNQTYFDAWLSVARRNPDMLFYAYTKNLKVWVARLGEIPPNLVLTASRGGKLDHLIAEHGLREAVVVYSLAEAERLGLPIDHDDSHAMKPGGSFALLIHGIQPKGSEAGKAVRALNGLGSYRRGRKNA